MADAREKPNLFTTGLQIVGLLGLHSATTSAGNQLVGATATGVAAQKNILLQQFEQTRIASEAAVLAGKSQGIALSFEASFIELEASMIMSAAVEQAEYLDVNNRRFQARQKVSFLKSGVDLSGTPLMVLAETRIEGLKEIESILEQAERVADLSSRRAKLMRREGRARMLSGRISAGSIFASGQLQLQAGFLSLDEQLAAARAQSKSRKKSSFFSTLLGIAGIVAPFLVPGLPPVPVP